MGVLLAGAGSLAAARWPDAACAAVRPTTLDRYLSSCQPAGTRAALAAGRQAMAVGDLVPALEHFRWAAAGAPDLAVAHPKRGEAAESLGELEEALAAFRRAARLAPSAAAHARVARVAAQMGEVDLAVAAFEAASGSLPHHLVAGLRAGAATAAACARRAWPAVVRIAARCPGPALGEARAALATSREAMPQSAFLVLVDAGRLDRAVELARRRGWVRPGDACRDGLDPELAPETTALLALLLQPDRADCALGIGLAFAEDGLVRLARRVLVDRARRSPDASVRARAGRVLASRLPAHEVPKLAESLNRVGWRLEHSLQRPLEAVATYRRAIAVDPDFSWPYSSIARIHAARHDDVGAAVWLEQAVAADPNDWRAWFDLGVVAHRLGRYDGAERAFRRAIALVPDDARAHANLGRALLRQGRQTEALRAFQTAVALDASLEWERTLLAASAARPAAGGPAAAVTAVRAAR